MRSGDTPEPELNKALAGEVKARTILVCPSPPRRPLLLVPTLSGGSIEN